MFIESVLGIIFLTENTYCLGLAYTLIQKAWIFKDKGVNFLSSCNNSVIYIHITLSHWWWWFLDHAEVMVDQSSTRALVYNLQLFIWLLGYVAWVYVTSSHILAGHIEASWKTQCYWVSRHGHPPLHPDVGQPWLNKKKNKAIVCELLWLTKISWHIDKCVGADTHIHNFQSRYDWNDVIFINHLLCWTN
jgi:hypothetical protein